MNIVVAAPLSGLEHVRPADIVGKLQRTHDGGSTPDGYGAAKPVPRASVRPLKLHDLFPTGRSFREHVCPTGVLGVTHAPTTTVLPEIATESPKPSLTTVSEPFSSAVSFHPDAVLAKT
jgi:hypothetical protein